MSSSTREEIVESLDALDAGLERLCGLSFDVLTTPERLRVLERLETNARRLRVPGHALLNQLVEQATDEELGSRLAEALANRLRISRTDANRRIAEAADLGDRRALTGESLPPQLTATADAQRQGGIGDEHIAVIRSFFRRLPDGVDLSTRQAAEADLADKAAAHHTEGWAASRRTDIGELALACGPDNRLAEKGWTTRKNARGETEWIPPPHLDYGQPRVNTFHHRSFSPPMKNRARRD